MKKIILGIFIFLTVASFAHAQEAYTQNGTPISPTQGVIQQTQGNTDISYTPLEPLPGLAQYETGNANFGQLLSMVFKLLIILAALIAVGSFVYAGISYMVSDVPLVKFDASKRLQAAFLGLAILLGSWIILFTINPQLVSFNGALNPVTVFQQSSINQNQNQQGVRITTEVNGTTIAPTIVASDNNAAISQVQTSGTSVDPAVLKQAADDIQ
ncbi:MAG: hypothetical protein QG621_120, partial [Patescibacteria group bacterium]|nr:hypothetical protein [Patescibacteria group bacterium]